MPPPLECQKHLCCLKERCEVQSNLTSTGGGGVKSMCYTPSDESQQTKINPCILPTAAQQWVKAHTEPCSWAISSGKQSKKHVLLPRHRLWGAVELGSYGAGPQGTRASAFSCLEPQLRTDRAACPWRGEELAKEGAKAAGCHPHTAPRPRPRDNR